MRPNTRQADRGEEPMMSVQTTEAAPRGGHRYQLESGWIG